MAYAKTLTRDYLEYLGITEVSEDGTKIMKGDKEIKQHSDGYYMVVSLYDPAIRQATPKEKRTNSTGQIYFGVHRIVYCWYNRIVPSGIVIDHKNCNKLDNRLSNLQPLTPKENLAKERPESTRELPCKLDRPRSYYEEKLAIYEARYEQAKADGNAEESHKQRTNVANINAKLRYWDSHREEITANIAAKHETKAKLDIDAITKKQNIKDRKLLEQYKQVFKEAGNKTMWHELCKVIKAWDSLAQIQKDHVFDTLHNFFSKYGRTL